MIHILLVCQNKQAIKTQGGTAYHPDTNLNQELRPRKATPKWSSVTDKLSYNQNEETFHRDSKKNLNNCPYQIPTFTSSTIEQLSLPGPHTHQLHYRYKDQPLAAQELQGSHGVSELITQSLNLTVLSEGET